MSTLSTAQTDAATTQRRMDFKLEIVVLPVADVDRAKEFYTRLGWRLDADFATGPDFRVIQVTPPGSEASVIFGTNVTTAAAGAADSLILTVEDIEAARADLVARGVDASEVFHDAGGGYNRFDPAVRASGPDPQRRTYASFVVFNDPDGNGWLLQEITARFAGRIDSDETAYASVPDLASALRRAEAAHGEHEKRTGQHDAEWADWYAAYMVAEQSGAELPL